MSVEKWATEYQKYSSNPPKEGTILRAYGGEDARLEVELVEGKAPFVYGRAYVPHIVGTELGWFLQAYDSESAYGFKCILLPKSREECLRKCGITKKRIRVKAIKLVRYSRAKTSILCEVAEYCPEADVVITDASGKIIATQDIKTRPEATAHEVGMYDG